MPKYVAVIDQSTTKTRCVIFDHLGRVCSSSEKEHRQIYLQAGRVEHRPLEIWKNTEQVIRSALSKLRAPRGSISAVGVANQRETTLVWNRANGLPYCNALVWQDTRSQNICDELGASGGLYRFRSKTGLPLASYFSGPKIKWILENVPGVRAAAERGEAIFGNMDTWEIWWLTGGPRGGTHVTDVTNASRTLLMNMETLDWDDEILKAFGIPRRMLPRIAPSSDPQTWGTTLSDGPFADCIPVCGDLGDQQASLVGQSCFAVGEAKGSYGTGCFLLLNVGAVPVTSESGLLATVAYKFGNQPAAYALEGAAALTGSLVQWLRENLGLVDSAPEIEQLALGVSDNGGICFVPPSTNLYAPHWGPWVRCAIFGIASDGNRGHLARAVLEAIAFQNRHVFEAMRNEARLEPEKLRVDGEMARNEWLMQFQSDILGLPLVRQGAETAALGAAYAAGLATGFWSLTSHVGHAEPFGDNRRTGRIWYPQMDPETRESLYQSWLRTTACVANQLYGSSSIDLTSIRIRR